MGRTIYATEQIKHFLLERDYNVSGQLEIGLIVGQQGNSSKDNVFLLVPTPTSDGTIDDIDEQWIVQHSIQVTRMMVGGLKVMGIFVISASVDLLKKLQPKLRQAVFAIHKNMKRKHIVQSVDKITDRIVLQVTNSGQARSINCKSVDVADPNSSMKPADWKFQSSIGWNVATSKLQVDIRIPLIATTGKSSLKKSFNSGLVPFFHSIQQAVGTVDDHLRSAQELFSSKPKSGKKGDNTATTNYHRIDLFSKEVCDDYKVVKSNCSSSFHLVGTIDCRAYLSSKATVEEAIQAVKDDAMRSLQARCDLLVEDLTQQYEDSENHISEGFERVTILPRKVYAQIPSMSYSVCDYVFPDEPVADSLERFSEILGIKITEDMLDLKSEPLPDIKNLMATTNAEVSGDDNINLDEITSKDASDKSRKTGYIAAALSISGAVIAAFISYLTLTSDGP